MKDNKGLLILGGLGVVALVLFVLKSKGASLPGAGGANLIPLSAGSVGGSSFMPDLSGSGSQFIIPILGGSGGSYQSTPSGNNVKETIVGTAGDMAHGSSTFTGPNFTVSPLPGSGGPY